MHCQQLRASRARGAGLLLVAALLLASGQRTLAAPSSAPTPVNVMAPLHVDDWNTFAAQARELKRIGVQSVSVDVWWGDVEKQRGRYDWSYYDRIFDVLKSARLKIVPIMSFHQCGGNVGDTYNAPIPKWIWNEVSGKRLNGVVTNPRNVRYQSEYGNTSDQCVALWADKAVLPIQHQFMKAFQGHFARLASNIQEISISGGPAGEMRYPSYDAHDGGRSGWPTRGALQAYSPLAQADFRRWALTKYGSLAGVNAAWGSQLRTQQEIRPPQNHDQFFDNRDYLGRYGRDLFEWYNDGLAQHIKRSILNADAAFSGAFAGIPVGVKLPGIHWQMDSNARYQRVAEMNAGLIPSRSEERGEYHAGNAHGYSRIVSAVRDAEAKLKTTRGQNQRRELVLHFTCLEMKDDPNNGNSKAYSLSTWVADAAHSHGVRLKGENALPIRGGAGWVNVYRHIRKDGYQGLTVLRMGSDLDVRGLENLIRHVSRPLGQRRTQPPRFWEAPNARPVVSERRAAAR